MDFEEMLHPCCCLVTLAYAPVYTPQLPKLHSIEKKKPCMLEVMRVS